MQCTIECYAMCGSAADVTRNEGIESNQIESTRIKSNQINHPSITSVRTPYRSVHDMVCDAMRCNTNTNTNTNTNAHKHTHVGSNENADAQQQRTGEVKD
mmetsp:Transcript_15398/g.33198  ORF Transcript_15398/g.33198 Transcript_15398/m.33198 type:complete len:100 (-) Transcript_15398:759-1058(-)